MEERAFRSVSRKGRHAYSANVKNALILCRNDGDLNSFRIVFLTNTDQALNYIVSFTLRPDYFKTPKSSDRIQFL